MSKKHTPTESNLDEKTIEGSDSFPQDNTAEREKLASLSDTTLQDLPIEILEHILIEVVTTEVKDAKLVKKMWKEKLDHVINRLITVSPLWSFILTTDIFRNEVNRILDGTAEKKIRLDTLKQCFLEVIALDVTTLTDEMFVLWRNDCHDHSINVYDLNSLDQVKDVIPLPGRNPLDLTGCSVSNCVFLLDKKKWFEVAVLRITKDDNNQFNVSELISIPWLPNPSLSITSTGDFILSTQLGMDHPVVSIYNASGSLQQEMTLSQRMSNIRHIIPKSDGNLVLVTFERRPTLTLINPNGSVMIRYMPPILRGDVMSVSRADVLGRALMIQRRLYRIVLADFGRNVFCFQCPDELPQYNKMFPPILHYNCERNEIVDFTATSADGKGVLTIIGFTEEFSPLNTDDEDDSVESDS